MTFRAEGVRARTPQGCAYPPSRVVPTSLCSLVLATLTLQAHKTPADYAKEQEKRGNYEILELLGEDAPLQIYKDGTHPVE